MSEEITIPGREWWQLADVLSRVDELLETLVVVEKAQLEILRKLSTAWGVPPPAVVAPPPAVPVVVKPEVLVPPAPTLPPLRLEPIEDLLEAFRRYVNYVEIVTGSVTSYMSREDTVVKDSPKNYNLIEVLLREGLNGYLSSDDGTVKVRVNGGEDLTLKAGETLDFNTYFKRPLAIRTVKLSTENLTPLGFRLFIW